MNLDALRADYHRHTPALQDSRGDYAVLVPLLPGPEGLSLLYEVRSSALRHHRGEVCFPGGRLEPGETPAACALRETWEELSLPPESVEVFGQADFLHLRSEGLMYPVIGLLPENALSLLRPNPQEVQEVFCVPLSYLRAHPPALYHYPLQPQVGPDFPYRQVQTPPDYQWTPGCMEVPVYSGLPHPLWGLTARITAHFLSSL